MTLPFTRTPSGRKAKWRFYCEVLVWVEGRTDFCFYSEILRGLGVKLQDSGGCGCADLVGEMIQSDAPYVVVRDGDYFCLECRRSRHKRLVMLHRYSSENYLFEEAACRAVSAHLAGTDPSDDPLDGEFERLLKLAEEKLFEAVALDVAAVQSHSELSVVPGGADPWLAGKRQLAFADGVIARACASARASLDPESISKATEKVFRFLRERRLVDILRGRFAFGLVRRLVFLAVRRSRGRTPYLEDAALRALLVKEVWAPPVGGDHASLRRRLRQAVRDASQLRKLA